MGKAGIYFPPGGATQGGAGALLCLKGAQFLLDVSWASLPILWLTAGIDFRLCSRAEDDTAVICFTSGPGLKGCVIHAETLSYNHFCVSNVPIPADLMELASAALLCVASDIFCIYQSYLQAHAISITATTAAFTHRTESQEGGSVASALNMGETEVCVSCHAHSFITCIINPWSCL